MYYVYQLKWRKLVNFIVVRHKSDLNCYKWLEYAGTKAEALRIQKIFALDAGKVWYPGCNSRFEYRGVQYATQRELACVMGITPYTLNARLRTYRQWADEWPEDLFEYVDEWPLTRPLIKDRKLVGEHPMFSVTFKGDV